MADTGSTTNLAGGAAKPAEPGAAAPGAADKLDDKDQRRQFNYALVKFCDMPDEVRAESVDMVVTAVEKHPGNYEVREAVRVERAATALTRVQAASKTIKEQMDKRCGSSWHVVVGEGFGFEITHEMRNLLHMYFGGSVGILVWKAS
ncbi:hypothetical protein HK105_200531 [Polyrhizophydium stewartii]|uniref:Dynein light chain n=1 Tax=Polyrhizophydium stewartii TaxID=2732419 RepID=A0ABR4NJG9_9FUNG|nr:Dynein light chain 4, axonemal [Polyrhizophydium stewartii]